jgi:hypothetical protein
MGMKKIAPKKLTLNAETIRTLDHDLLLGVAGADTDEASCYSATCPPPTGHVPSCVSFAPTNCTKHRF